MGRERQRQRNINPLPLISASTRDQTCNFLAYGMMLQPTTPARAQRYFFKSYLYVFINKKTRNWQGNNKENEHFIFSPDQRS